MNGNQMQDVLHYDDLQPGDEWVSRARTITETDVVNFAALTGDYDPLHVDHEFARNTPFRQPIAHGLLGLSMMAGLSSGFPAVKTDAFVQLSEWRFVKPIFFGDTVHVVTSVTSKQPTGRRRGKVLWKRQLVNQHDEVVQEGVLETLVAVAPRAQIRKAA